MGVAIMNYTICDVCRPYQLHTEASFSPKLTDSLCLQVDQVPRSPDLVIFVSTTTTAMTEPVALPLCMHAG